jgi:hypothetical protein
MPGGAHVLALVTTLLALLMAAPAMAVEVAPGLDLRPAGAPKDGGKFWVRADANGTYGFVATYNGGAPPEDLAFRMTSGGPFIPYAELRGPLARNGAQVLRYGNPQRIWGVLMNHSEHHWADPAQDYDQTKYQTPAVDLDDTAPVVKRSDNGVIATGKPVTFAAFDAETDLAGKNGQAGGSGIDPASVQIDWGDGTTDPAFPATHTYALAPGETSHTYTRNVVVRDLAGNVTAFQLDLTVVTALDLPDGGKVAVLRDPTQLPENLYGRVGATSNFQVERAEAVFAALNGYLADVELVDAQPLLKDLAKMRGYRAIVFPYMRALTRQQRVNIATFAKLGGGVVALTYFARDGENHKGLTHPSNQAPPRTVCSVGTRRATLGRERARGVFFTPWVYRTLYPDVGGQPAAADLSAFLAFFRRAPRSRAPQIPTEVVKFKGVSYTVIKTGTYAPLSRSRARFFQLKCVRAPGLRYGRDTEWAEASELLGGNPQPPSDARKLKATAYLYKAARFFSAFLNDITIKQWLELAPGSFTPGKDSLAEAIDRQGHAYAEYPFPMRVEPRRGTIDPEFVGPGNGVQTSLVYSGFDPANVMDCQRERQADGTFSNPTACRDLKHKNARFAPGVAAGLGREIGAGATRGRVAWFGVPFEEVLLSHELESWRTPRNINAATAILVGSVRWVTRAP